MSYCEMSSGPYLVITYSYLFHFVAASVILSSEFRYDLPLILWSFNVRNRHIRGFFMFWALWRHGNKAFFEPTEAAPITKIFFLTTTNNIKPCCHWRFWLKVRFYEVNFEQKYPGPAVDLILRLQLPSQSINVHTLYLDLSTDHYIVRPSILLLYFSFAASFIIYIMGLIALSLIVTIWILNLYFHSDGKPVPKWIKRLVLEWIAAILCVRCGGPPKPKISPLVGAVVLNGDVSTTEKSEKEVNLPEYLRAYIMGNVERGESAAISEQNRGDWQSLARVLDRLFLIIFLAGMVVITVMYYNDYKNK